MGFSRFMVRNDGARKPIWANASGWEYDLLRSLSPDTAAQLWSNASRRGLLLSFATAKYWLWTTGAMILFGPIFLAILIVAAQFGLGWVGRIALDILLLHRPVGYFITLMLRSLLRPYVREELFLFARSELTVGE